MKIRIDQEFAALIPAVAGEADGDLEREILADGRILNPFIVWDHQNILLDGHRRHRITVRHPTLKIPPPIVMHFESRQEAHDWIIRHQLSKRNVTDAQRRYLIGKLYSDKRPAIGSNQHEAKRGSATVADPQSAREIAASEGVSERTVHNNAAFAEAVDAAAEVAPEIKAAVLSGDVKATTADLEKVAAMPKGKAKKVGKKLKSGKAKTVKAAVKEIESESKPDDEKETSAAVDGWGVPVQEHAKEAFGAVVKFDELLSLLRKADRLYSEIAALPGGAYLRRPGVSVNARDRWKHAGIKDAILAVQDSKPTFTVCPYEYHARAFPDSKHKHDKNCVLCKGLNWARPLGKEEISEKVVAVIKEAFGV